jgi:hypothetical protein
MISFICPTKDRPDRHEHLWRQYVQQAVWPKELCVGGDSERPYFYSTEKLTLGEKRNRLCRHASGDVIAHLDDDDYYAPNYAAHMLGKLAGFHFARLCHFRVYDERNSSTYECDTLSGANGKLLGKRWSGVRVPAWLSKSSDALRFGYGFSYIYLRALWEQVPFNTRLTLREDVDFAKRCIRAGALVRQVNDGADLATHVVHGASTSTAFVTGPITRTVVRVAAGYSVGGGLPGLVFGHAVERTLRP